MRISADSHSTGEKRVVIAVDSSVVDLGVAEAAHLHVHEVIPSPDGIWILAGAGELAALLPRRRARHREHEVDQVPALLGGGGTFVGGHRSGYHPHREPKPELLGICSPVKGPGRGEVPHWHRR